MVWVTEPSSTFRTDRLIGRRPGEFHAASWRSRLASLKSRGAADGDPRVVECRQALAFLRVSKAIDTAVGELSATDVDQLVEALRQAVAS